MERSKSRRDKSQGEIKSKELSKLRRDQSQGEIKVKERSKSRRDIKIQDRSNLKDQNQVSLFIRILI